MTTIKDIAKNLGVSYSTVSRCLNNDPKMATSTREKVLEEANRLNFSFNINARNLVKKKTNTIGVIFSNHFKLQESRWFYNEIEYNLIKSIEKHSYNFIFQPNNNIQGESNLLKMVNGKMVDGIIIVSRDIKEEEISLLERINFPHAYLYLLPRGLEYDSTKNYFYDDNFYGGYIVTKYLIDLGHKDILTITSDNKDLKMYDFRTRGYLKAMKEANLNPIIIESQMRFEDSICILNQNISYIKKSSALFVQQDLVALSLIQQLEKYHDIIIPNDKSIVGYNNIDLIKYLDIELDSIEDPRADVIKNSVEYVINCISNKNTNHINNKLYPRLIKRGSAASI